MLSPLLFTIYLDQLILSLKDLGVGCHLNGMFVGAFSSADNVTLFAPTNMALKAMLNKCTELAASHNLLFNASKTKCMHINGPRSQTQGVFEFMGTAIDFVDRAELLGVSICCYSAVTVLLRCCYGDITVLFECCDGAVTVLLQCCYSAVIVLLQCCYSAVTVLLQCCYSAVTVLLQ